MTTRKFYILLFMILGNTLTSFSQKQEIDFHRKYIAYQANEELCIDGNADESSWENSKWSDSFIDIEGVKKPLYRTQMKMLWDETYLYIFAKMEEPHVWGTLKQKDTIIFYNNDFEVFIDPDGDTHNYYEIEINALNTVWDLFLTKPYREKNVVLNDFNITGLKSAVQVIGTLNNFKDTDKAWQIEIAIPWNTFKTSYFEDVVPKNKFWRINFSRVNWQFDIVDGNYQRKKAADGAYLPEYNWVWSPIGVINMHEPEMWGYVFFSTEKPGSKINFTIPEDESVKMELYKLYKAQHNYFNQNKKWATSIQDLSDDSVQLNGKRMKFQLHNHAAGWNISTQSPFSQKTFRIVEDGKILSEETK